MPMANGSSGTPTMGLATLMNVFGSGVTLRYNTVLLSGYQEGLCPLPGVHVRQHSSESKRTAE